MSMAIQFNEHRASIKVIGVGGAGCNAVNTMIASGLGSVDFIVANTDRQALEQSSAPIKVQIGAELTRGLGAGANPEVGRQAALEDRERLEELVRGSDMVFVAAGMGGGTGTGAAPVIAEVAREAGALTVGVVTRPFLFEGKVRSKVAMQGLEELQRHVDSLIVIPNEKLFTIAQRQTTLLEGFRMADGVLLHAIKSISDLINVPGLINLDFADVKTIMADMGMAFMGMGVHSGENRAAEAARKAISNPLLDEISIRGARGMLINITGSSTMTFQDLEEATKFIREEAHEEANIIFGAAIDESLGDRFQVTVIATGFSPAREQAQGAGKAAERVVTQLEDVRLEKMRQEARVVKLGTIISEFADDGSYDIPTFLRNEQQV